MVIQLSVKFHAQILLTSQQTIEIKSLMDGLDDHVT